jgi:hypothetical protein
VPVDLTLVTDDANVTVSALFTASDRLEDTAVALERVDRALGFGTLTERLRGFDTLDLLSRADESIERAVRSSEDLAEALPYLHIRRRSNLPDEDLEL